MASYTEYFSNRCYQPKYHLGDRVRGTWNKIPFSGTVYIDRKSNDDSPPVVIVHSDLPIQHKNSVVSMIQVDHLHLNLLK